MAGHKTLQKMIKLYKMKTGKTELDPAEIAAFAVKNGVELPEPVDPMKQLIKQISAAAREEMRTDRVTGRPYRAYHSLPVKQGQDTFFFWVDIEDATREQMVRSTNRRREQIVGDVVQLTFDLDHWAAANPDEEPIEVEKDFGPDVEWRKAADNDDEAA